MAHQNAEKLLGIKRVETLYRVSTKGQIDGNDISMQKNACRQFIERQEGWQLVKEYSELGVSGFSKSAKDRDVIQHLQIDVEMGLFDILLVFMFDRLGRKDDETPFVVEWFSNKGIEVWSVVEGEQRFDSNTDKLINFLRYWQSSGESIKTSIRVNERHTQMVKEGLFRGGEPPYGYKLVKAGLLNKKDKELSKLAVDEYESENIKEMFRLVYEEGYGGNRIANYLNENKKPTRKNTTWRASVVNYILRNPIYKGYMTYNKSKGKREGGKKNSIEEWILSETANPELVIVPENVWDKVQKIRTSRTPEKMKKSENIERANTLTKSPLLFVGMIKCGYCGSPLTTTYHDKKWNTKDGVEHVARKAKYRCSGKAQRAKDCDGQTIYSQNRIEKTVLSEVDVYLKQLKSIDLSTQIKKFKHKYMDNDVQEANRLRRQLEEAYKELSALKKEVSKSILGKSRYNEELLSELIKDKDSEINMLLNTAQEIEKIVIEKKAKVDDMVLLQKYVPCWEEELEKATIARRKVMLSTLIDNITVYKDRIEVKIKLELLEFIKAKN